MYKTAEQIADAVLEKCAVSPGLAYKALISRAMQGGAKKLLPSQFAKSMGKVAPKTVQRAAGVSGDISNVARKAKFDASHLQQMSKRPGADPSKLLGDMGVNRNRQVLERIVPPSGRGELPSSAAAALSPKNLRGDIYRETGGRSVGQRLGDVLGMRSGTLPGAGFFS